jgi:hypothetical protein
MMTTNTYVALDKKTVTTAVTSVEFTGISQAYTDLVVVINAQTSSDTQIRLQLNGNTGANYSSTVMAGDGSTAFSIRVSNENSMNIGGAGTQFGTTILNFNNYSNTTTNKTVLADYKSTSSSYGETGAKVGLWRNTNAITSILFLLPGSFTYSAGSTFSLYGILAEGVSPAPKATGGAIYSDDLYYYHAFGSTGVFTPLQSLSCDVLTVAGGGGAANSGAGGAGGLRAFTSQSMTTTNYAITVGAGGAAGTGSAKGTNGGPSSITGSGFTTLAVSGGGGGAFKTQSAPGNVGNSGGSGGGGGPDDTGSSGGAGGAGNTGAYSPVEGYAGGAGLHITPTFIGGGGGGGAGAVGASIGASTAPNGGAGANTYNAINFSTWLTATGTGSNGYVAGGGGGCHSTATLVGMGGIGGGGNGTTTSGTSATAGQANTGGGGGAGAWNLGTDARPGGSGLVILRYLKA